MDEDGPEGPNVGGALHNCLLCHQPGCERHEPCCPRCRTNCKLCGTVKAVENCDRCVRRASRELAKLKEGGNKSMRVKRLHVITAGAAGINITVAREILKPSGLPPSVIFKAAGGGAAGTKAVNSAAVVFASKLEQVFREGGDVTKCFITTKKKSSCKKGVPIGMTAPVAIDAVHAVATRRAMEPMYGDVPADCLATAAELFAEAGDGVTDALVLAGLSKALEVVNELIVERVRDARTHYHGWSASRIEALEGFARSEAKKAIRRVLARSRAAVDARRAKQPRKKKIQRAKDAKRRAAMKAGTHVPKRRLNGDSKIHFKRGMTVRDRKRRLKSAYNKVEKYGPGACTPDDIKKHAAHKKILESRRKAHLES